MPDLTLYRDDIFTITSALRIAVARLERQGAMNDSVECQRLANLLIDRNAQGLHPERPTHQRESD